MAAITREAFGLSSEALQLAWRAQVEPEEALISRGAVMRSGLYLSVRHGLDVPLALVGETLMARWMGPVAYGLWIAASRLSFYLCSVTSLNLSQCLLRKPGQLSKNDYDQAFTLLLALGTTTTALSLLGLRWLVGWFGFRDLSPILASFVFATPLVVTTAIPRAWLERSLKYREISIVEVSGRALFYATGAACAFAGWGVWAAAAAFWGQQLLLALLFYLLARYAPRLHLDRKTMWETLGSGVRYSGAQWIMQARSLVNPIVVGKLCGAAVVGYIGLAERIVQGLCFFGAAAWRLSLVVLARVAHERQRMARAVSEGMELQILLRAPFVLAGVVLLPMSISRVFGAQWSPVMDIYPFIAAAALLHALFVLHSAALFTLEKNSDVALFHAANVMLFAISALILVRAFGWIGYGWAEAAALPSYAVLDFYIRKRVAGIEYQFSASLTAAAVLALFWNQLGWFALSGIVTMAAWPFSWKVVSSHVAHLRSAMFET